MKPGQSEHYLAWVDRELGRIEDVESCWHAPDFSADERIGTRAEWHDVVNRYLAVVAAHDNGQLPSDLLPRLFEVSARLAQAAPMLERMRLRRADPDVLARVLLAATA